MNTNILILLQFCLRCRYKGRIQRLLQIFVQIGLSTAELWP